VPTSLCRTGPFADLAQLKGFEDALASIPTIEDVYICTIDGYYARFELRIAEPTLLIAQLRALPDPLRVIDGTRDDPRLEIVRDSGECAANGEPASGRPPSAARSRHATSPPAQARAFGDEPAGHTTRAQR
jgi:hypothetical protein